MEEAGTRDYGFDNIRCILMFLVVFAHFLEFCDVPGSTFLYKLIYLFHIPCLLFLSGYFTKETPSTFRFCVQIIRYILFQGAYLVFARFFLGEEVLPQFTTPYWILWYLLASIIYPVFLYAYRLDTSAKRYWAVSISFLVALLAGFDDSIGYNLSLSRLLAFQPYFLMGYCFRREESMLLEFLGGAATIKRTVLSICLLGLLLSGFYVLRQEISSLVLHRSVPYSQGIHSMLQRAVISLLAVAWIAFFVLYLRQLLSMPLPLISRIGSNTLPVYLFHGFLLRILRHYQPALLNSYGAIFLITALCLLIFGNPMLTRMISPKPKQLQEN